MRKILLNLSKRSEVDVEVLKGCFLLADRKRVRDRSDAA